MFDGDQSIPSDSIAPTHLPTRTEGAVRAKSGCYTCRIRRKRCDERVNEEGSCQTCVRLRLQCLGFGPKRPKWMRDESSVAEFRSKIKAVLVENGMIRGHTSSTRSADTTTTIRPRFLDTSTALLSQDDTERMEEFELLEDIKKIRELREAEELGRIEDVRKAEEFEVVDAFQRSDELEEVEELDIVDTSFRRCLSGDHEANALAPQSPPHSSFAYQPDDCRGVECSILGDSNCESNGTLMLELQPSTKERAFVCTPYSLFVSAIIIGLGAPKAIASYRGEEVTTNALDWIIGVPMAVISFWLGVMKEQKACACLNWFLNDDFRDIPIRWRVILEFFRNLFMIKYS